jgi:hypothetical protein
VGIGAVNALSVKFARNAVELAPAREARHQRGIGGEVLKFVPLKTAGEAERFRSNQPQRRYAGEMLVDQFDLPRHGASQHWRHFHVNVGGPERAQVAVNGGGIRVIHRVMHERLEKVRLDDIILLLKVPKLRFDLRHQPVRVRHPPKSLGLDGEAEPGIG